MALPTYTFLGIYSDLLRNQSKVNDPTAEEPTYAIVAEHVKKPGMNERIISLEKC